MVSACWLNKAPTDIIGGLSSKPSHVQAKSPPSHLPQKTKHTFNSTFNISLNRLKRNTFDSHCTIFPCKTFHKTPWVSGDHFPIHEIARQKQWISSTSWYPYTHLSVCLSLQLFLFQILIYVYVDLLYLNYTSNPFDPNRIEYEEKVISSLLILKSNS